MFLDDLIGAGRDPLRPVPRIRIGVAGLFAAGLDKVAGAFPRAIRRAAELAGRGPGNVVRRLAGAGELSADVSHRQSPKSLLCGCLSERISAGKVPPADGAANRGRRTEGEHV